MKTYFKDVFVDANTYLDYLQKHVLNNILTFISWWWLDWLFSVDPKYQEKISHINAVIGEVKEPAQWKALLPSSKHQLIRTDESLIFFFFFYLFPCQSDVHLRPPAVVSKHCNWTGISCCWFFFFFNMFSLLKEYISYITTLLDEESSHVYGYITLSSNSYLEFMK